MNRWNFSGLIRVRREQVFDYLAWGEAARFGEIGQAVSRRRRNQQPKQALTAPGEVGLIPLSCGLTAVGPSE
jgi:hypothetical protein